MANDLTHAPDGSMLNPLEQAYVREFRQIMAEREAERAATGRPAPACFTLPGDARAGVGRVK